MKISKYLTEHTSQWIAMKMSKPCPEFARHCVPFFISLFVLAGPFNCRSLSSELCQTRKQRDCQCSTKLANIWQATSRNARNCQGSLWKCLRDARLYWMTRRGGASTVEWCWLYRELDMDFSRRSFWTDFGIMSVFFWGGFEKMTFGWWRSFGFNRMW